MHISGNRVKVYGQVYGPLNLLPGKKRIVLVAKEDRDQYLVEMGNGIYKLTWSF